MNPLGRGIGTLLTAGAIAAQAAVMPPSAIAGDTPIKQTEPDAVVVAPKNGDVGRVLVANTVTSKPVETADAFQITTPTEARKFAEKYLVKSPSDIDKGFEGRMQMLVDIVSFKEGSTAYAPKLFVKRLFNLQQGGVLSEDNVILYLNHKNIVDTYGSAGNLRRRITEYEAAKNSMSPKARLDVLKGIQDDAATDVKDLSCKSSAVASKEN